MNKRTLRSFSFGILFSAAIMGSILLYRADPVPPSTTLSVKSATQLLKDSNYTVLTDEEYKKLTQSLNLAEQSAKDAEAKLAEALKSKSVEEEKTVPILKLEILRGMVSHEIALTLYEHGIIEDPAKFELYLEDNGYSKRIQLGTYSITADMSYDEIAKTITKS